MKLSKIKNRNKYNLGGFTDPTPTTIEKRTLNTEAYDGTTEVGRIGRNQVAGVVGGLKGSAKGASMGSAGGTFGTLVGGIIGGVVGTVSGGIKNIKDVKAKEKERKKQLEIDTAYNTEAARQNMANLDAYGQAQASYSANTDTAAGYQEQGTSGLDFYGKKGGRMCKYDTGGKVVKGGVLVPLSKDTKLAQGNKHSEGGMVDKNINPNAEFEGGETIVDKGKENIIMSNDPTMANPATGNTFAKDDTKLAKAQGKYENKPKTTSNLNAITAIKSKRLRLQDLQQNINGNYGEEGTHTMPDGSVMENSQMMHGGYSGKQGKGNRPYETLNTRGQTTLMKKGGVVKYGGGGNSRVTAGSDEWINQILDFETKQGSQQGTGLSDYGINRVKWEKKYPSMWKDGKVDKNEAIKFIKTEYIPQVKNYPIEVQKRLIDYSYNTGRNVRDLLLKANGNISLDEIQSTGTNDDLWKSKEKEILSNMKNPNFLKQIDDSKHEILKDTWARRGTPDVYEKTSKDRINMWNTQPTTIPTTQSKGQVPTPQTNIPAGIAAPSMTQQLVGNQYSTYQPVPNSVYNQPTTPLLSPNNNTGRISNSSNSNIKPNSLSVPTDEEMGAKPYKMDYTPKDNFKLSGSTGEYGGAIAQGAAALGDYLTQSALNKKQSKLKMANLVLPNPNLEGFISSQRVNLDPTKAETRRQEAYMNNFSRKNFTNSQAAYASLNKNRAKTFENISKINELESNTNREILNSDLSTNMGARQRNNALVNAQQKENVENKFATDDYNNRQLQQQYLSNKSKTDSKLFENIGTITQSVMNKGDQNKQLDIDMSGLSSSGQKEVNDAIRRGEDKNKVYLRVSKKENGYRKGGRISKLNC